MTLSTRRIGKRTFDTGASTEDHQEPLEHVEHLEEQLPSLRLKL